MVTLTPAARAKIDAYLDAYVTPGHPGTMVGLKNKAGEVLYYRSVGGDVTGRPYEEDTVWWIASCSKLLTSIAAMQLVEAGKIGLDDPLGEVVPALKAPDMIVNSSETSYELAKPKTPITLRMLLTHTAGFSYPWYNQDLLNWVHQNGPKAHDEQLKYPLVHGGLELNGSVAGVDATYAAGPLVLLPGQRKGWGLCSLLNLDDIPGNRKAGTAEWGGVANLMWIADRTSEVGIIIFNQSLPYGLPKFIETMVAVHGAVYDGGLE